MTPAPEPPSAEPPDASAGSPDGKPAPPDASKDVPKPPGPPGAASEPPDDPVHALETASPAPRRPRRRASTRRRGPDRARQAEWVARLQARDESALTEVVAAFGQRITAVVTGILRDQDAVEDVVQATFTKAWFRIGSFRGGSGLYTWLYRVAINSAKDYIKGRQRRPAVALDDQQAARLPADAPHVLEGLERRELRLEVRRAIGDLPERYRIVLALRELEGMTYDEIAEVTGLSLGTVESRLFRARRRLGEILKRGPGATGPTRHSQEREAQEREAQEREARGREEGRP